MSVAAGIPPEVQTYLSAVREALADLPAEERDDLLSEVEASLAEAAGEGGSSLTARLGPPHEFAAELRSAAGLQAGTETERPAWTAIAGLVEKLRSDPVARASFEVAGQLAPIWWVARAYLAVAAYAIVSNLPWSAKYPVPIIGASADATVFLIFVAAAASTALGLATRKAARATRQAITVFNILLLLSIPLVIDRVQGTRAATIQEPIVVSAEPSAGLTFNGQRVENIYPYSRDGKLLHDVLLFDAAGQPLTIPGNDPLRRFLKTPGGRTIFNSFPIRHFEPGTRTVANPNAGPAVWLPKVATPPLRQRR